MYDGEPERKRSVKSLEAESIIETLSSIPTSTRSSKQLTRSVLLLLIPRTVIPTERRTDIRLAEGNGGVCVLRRLPLRSSTGQN